MIDRFALIENILNQVIEQYLAPSKEVSSFFWNVLLDSSILPIGSKVKLAMAIAQESRVKLDQKALHSVMSMRNAFAHHKIDSHPLVKIHAAGGGEVRYRLQIVRQSGKVDTMSREDALAEFNASFSVVKESLVALLRKIRELKSSASAN